MIASCSGPGHLRGGRHLVPTHNTQTQTTQPFIPFQSRFGASRTLQTAIPVAITSADEKTYLSTIDEEKEQARRARRMMFSFDDWRRHRSNSRFLRHLQTITDSGIFRGVKQQVLWVIALTFSIASYNHFHSLGQLPFWLPAPPRIAIECLAVTSFALSLLLVFRTNASYARWEEARRSFGAITTVSRDVARQAYSWFRQDDWEHKAMLSRWLVALAKSSMTHLRSPEEHNFRQELKGTLTPHELALLEASPHRPNFCIQVMTKIIKSADLPQELVIRMDENISRIVSAVSACERILNTPIPMSYTRHTGRFLMAWMASMPFALWHYSGWAMVPMMTLIAFVLLGIEEIGIYIEEPFSLLPLEALSDKLGVMLGRMRQEHESIDTYLGATRSPQPEPQPQPQPV